jgi:hypothetical protein
VCVGGACQRYRERDAKRRRPASGPRKPRCNCFPPTDPNFLPAFDCASHAGAVHLFLLDDDGGTMSDFRLRRARSMEIFSRSDYGLRAPDPISRVDSVHDLSSMATGMCFIHK